MDLVLDCTNFRMGDPLPSQRGIHWMGHQKVPSTGLPLEESTISIYLTVETPWEVVRLDGASTGIPRLLAGQYRLTFRPNSPAALKELIIDPDPGPGEPV